MMDKHDDHDAGAPALDTPEQRRQHLVHEIHHYAHMLSEQGPMNITFVHNNTLLGLQHLHFEAAVTEARRVMGGRGYEPLAQYRGYHASGRISDADIDRSLDERAGLDLGATLAQVAGQPVAARSVLRAHLVHGIDPADADTFASSFPALGGDQRFMADVPPASRQQLLRDAEAALRSDRARLGRDWTLSDWLGDVLGLDITGLVVRTARQHLHSPAPAERVSLQALGVSGTLTAGYEACVDRLGPADAGAGPQQREAWRRHYLQTEQRVLDTLARRHLGVPGRLDALVAHVEADLEAFALRRLWQRALALSGSPDPIGPTDPHSLQPREARADAPEAWIDLLRRSDPVDGPPVALSPAQAAQVDAWLAAVDGPGEDLDRMRTAHAGTLEALHTAWRDGLLDAAGVRALARLGAQWPQVFGPEAAALAEDCAQRLPRRQMVAFAHEQLQADVARVGDGWTHADWLATLTGTHVLDRVNAYMIRVCSAFLDEGLASWHMPDRRLGFFGAWRQLAQDDLSFALDGVDGWRDELAALPDRAEDTLLLLMQRLGLAPAQWGNTVARLLAQLKGWAGMAYWYELHPQHYKQAAHPIDTAQYLAVRLFSEWMCVRQLCREQWGLGTTLAELQQHLAAQPEAYLLRRALHGHQLHDTLAGQARQVLADPRGRGLAAVADAAWLHLGSRRELEHTCHGAWRLYRLAQLMGWSAQTLATLADADRQRLLAALDGFGEAAQSPIWLAAFERHYRDEILNAMALNRGRGRWAKGRTRRPKSQVVFCIDEREENIHRHYEELDPDHETLGAAGFFGVAQAFIALDDHDHTPLCPAVATPAHRILEVPRREALAGDYPVHKRRTQWMDVFHSTYWESKRNLLSSFFLINLAGLFMSVPLLGRVLAPHRFSRMADNVHHGLVPSVRTRLTHVRLDESQVALYGLKTLGLPIGFTVEEASDRVEASLRNWGLAQTFSRIVVICAHRSISVNNPHENAHDCGACGGKAGGPNARLFAALANHPPVRQILKARGIEIPIDTWFVGAEHNTASSEILYFDTEDIPPALIADWQVVHRDLEEARKRSARERCRRFASAPKDVSIEESTRHVEMRTKDLSQVRPEWGHCTNAFAVVGRRMITQGVFFDRRGFVISYDPTTDPDGKILERILMAVGPVGAGISLEYYFSTVDPVVYGCDTKVPHNVTGMIGVMAGAHGDLQTGLPRQMTEVHEAMRLQLVVDAKMEVLGGIYGRQAAIRQLLDNQWVHLIAHDPDTGEFNLFVPGKGFVKWDEPLQPIPEVGESFDWFKGHHECFLPPAFIREPDRPWTERPTSGPQTASQARTEFQPVVN